MRRFFIDVFGVSFEIVLNGSESISRLFPILSRLPRAGNGCRWRIQVSCKEDVSKEYVDPASTASIIRLYPDTALYYRLDKEKNIHASTKGVVLHISPCLRTATLHYEPGEIFNAERTARFAIGEMLRHEGFYQIHAGAVEFQGGAVLICAAPGMGKSTLTAAWAGTGAARLMSDDQTILFSRGKALWAGGLLDSLALTQKSEEILRDLGIRIPAACGSFEKKNQYDCYQFFLRICGDPYPIRAVVFIVDEGPEQIRLCRPDIAGKFLLKQSFYIGDGDTMKGHFETVLDLVNQSPAYTVPHGVNCLKTISEMEDELTKLPVPVVPMHSGAQRRAPSIAPSRTNELIKECCNIISSTVLNTKSQEGPLNWDDLLRVADCHGMLSVLGKSLQTNGTIGSLDCRLQRAVEAEISSACAIREMHLAEIKHITAAFKQGKIPWAVVNGPSIAERFYEFPETRPYHFLEIITVPELEDGVKEALCGAGYTLRSEGKNKIIFLKDSVVQYQIHLCTDYGPLIPLKRSIRADMKEIIKRAEEIRVKGTVFPVMALSDQLILSSIHIFGTQHHCSLQFHLDLSLIARQADRDTYKKVEKDANKMGVFNIVALALKRSQVFFPLWRSSEISTEMRPSLSAGLLSAVINPASTTAEQWARPSRIRRNLFSMVLDRAIIK